MGLRADGCSICEGAQDRRAAVDRALAMGKYPALIEREVRGLFVPGTKAEAISRHRDHWLVKVKATDRDVMARLSGAYKGSPDLAELVRDDVRRRVEDGELAPTISHGLQAQALIDRREERAQDRELAIGLARMLSGARGEPPASVIDGHHTRALALGDGRGPDREPAPLPGSTGRTTESLA